MLQDIIKQDMIVAMKARNEIGKNILRLVVTAMKNESIAFKKELSEEEQLKVLQREVKRLREGAIEFEKAGRMDLVEQAQAELSVLEVYMPVQLSDEELEQKIRVVVEQIGAQSVADMGRVMGMVMKEVGGGADGGRVREIVQKILS